MFAARNVALCTKDCICLFVCPSGATDTENGQIDAEKCIDGCRLCVDACPSHAIYLVNRRYPKRAHTPEEVKEVMSVLLARKAGAHIRALAAGDKAPPIREALYRSLALSNQVLAEDCIRETGYMIPETEKIRDLASSRILENLYTETFEEGDGKSVSTILNSIINALAENRDAAPVDAFLCEECGHITLDEKPEKCPHCSSTAVQSV